MGALRRVRKAELGLRSKAMFPSLLPTVATRWLRLLQNGVAMTRERRVKRLSDVLWANEVRMLDLLLWYCCLFNS